MLTFCRHSRENGNPVLLIGFWIPASAGMTTATHTKAIFNSLLERKKQKDITNQSLY